MGEGREGGKKQGVGLVYFFLALGEIHRTWAIPSYKLGQLKVEEFARRRKQFLQ